MKRAYIIVSIMLISLVVLLGSLFMIFNRSEEISDEAIMGLIVKENFVTLRDYIGPLYERSIRDGEDSFESLEEQYGDVSDFYVKERKDEKIRSVTYTVVTKDQVFDCIIYWEKQPIKYMISAFEIITSDEEDKEFKPVSDISSSDSEELELENIDILLSILNTITLRSEKTFQPFLKEDFGSDFGLVVESESDILNYLYDDLFFTKLKINSFSIDEPIYSELHDITTYHVHINPNSPGSLTWIVTLNGDNKITALYFQELEDLKKAYIFHIPENEVSNLNKRAIEKELINDQHYYLLENRYNTLYANMSHAYREKISYEDFYTYMMLMRQRTGIESLNNAYGLFSDMDTSFGQDFCTYRQVIYSDTMGLPSWINERDNLSFYLNYQQDVVLEDEDYVVNDFFLSRINAYSVKSTNQQLTSDQIEEIYFPQLVGQWTELSKDENTEVRFQKIDQLVKALIYKDWDKLWEIESKYTQLDSVEALQQLVGYQEKVVGSFEGVYMPRIGYEWGIAGAYILEIAFMTYDGNLNKLLVTFDCNNEIIDFNVMHIFYGESNEEN